MDYQRRCILLSWNALGKDPSACLRVTPELLRGLLKARRLAPIESGVGSLQLSEEVGAPNTNSTVSTLKNHRSMLDHSKDLEIDRLLDVGAMDPNASKASISTEALDTGLPRS